MSRFNDRYFPSQKYQRLEVISSPRPTLNGIGEAWIVCPSCESNVKALEPEGVCLRCANLSTYEDNWKTEVPEQEKLVQYNDPELLKHRYKS